MVLSSAEFSNINSSQQKFSYSIHLHSIITLSYDHSHILDGLLMERNTYIFLVFLTIHSTITLLYCELKDLHLTPETKGSGEIEISNGKLRMFEFDTS